MLHYVGPLLEISGFFTGSSLPNTERKGSIRGELPYTIKVDVGIIILQRVLLR